MAAYVAGERHARRAEQYRRRLNDLSGIIRTQLAEQQGLPEVTIGLPKDAWQMIMLALAMMRKS